MKPVPIPDQLVWPGARLVIFGPPEGHDQRLLEILPVTGVMDKATDGVGRVHFMIGLEDGDLERIQARGWFWLVMYSAVTPFAVEHPEADDWFNVPEEEP
jgi:hypothetical protein